MEECIAGLSQASTICSVSQRQFGQPLRKLDDFLSASDSFKLSAERESKSKMHEAPERLGCFCVNV